MHISKNNKWPKSLASIGGDNMQHTAQKCLWSEGQKAKSVSEQLEKE